MYVYEKDNTIIITVIFIMQQDVNFRLRCFFLFKTANQELMIIETETHQKSKTGYTSVAGIINIRAIYSGIGCYWL